MHFFHVFFFHDIVYIMYNIYMTYNIIYIYIILYVIYNILYIISLYIYYYLYYYIYEMSLFYLLFRLKKNYFIQKEIFARFSRFEKLLKNKSWQNGKS